MNAWYTSKSKVSKVFLLVTLNGRVSMSLLMLKLGKAFPLEYGRHSNLQQLDGIPT